MEKVFSIVESEDTLVSRSWSTSLNVLHSILSWRLIKTSWFLITQKMPCSLIYLKHSSCFVDELCWLCCWWHLFCMYSGVWESYVKKFRYHVFFPFRLKLLYFSFTSFLETRWSIIYTYFINLLSFVFFKYACQHFFKFLKIFGKWFAEFSDVVG